MASSDPRLFEWDDAKAASNFAKHGIAFLEAVRVFRDPSLFEFDASRLEDREVRTKAVGEIQSVLFTVVYTIRAGAIRIILARRCNSRERKLYGSHDH